MVAVSLVKRGAGSVAGSGSSDGKRKWGEQHGDREGAGSGSGARNDGKQHRGEYMGVRNRGFAVEIKKWYEGVDFYKELKMTEGEAAIIHDLARLYLNPEWKRLNIQELESRMQKEDPALARFGRPLHIGKAFLMGFVEKHPLKALTQVEGTAKERADWMKEEIIVLAPDAYKRLKEKIAREHSSRAGRQNKDADEIPPLVHGSDLLQLNKEIQDLKATIGAQNAEITFLKEVKEAEILSLTEAKEAEIISLKEANEAEIIFLKEACDAAVKTKDAALKAMNAAQEGRDIVMEELYSVHQAARAASVTPFKPGVAMREEYPQNESNPVSESWMEHMNWTTISRHYSTGHN